MEEAPASSVGTALDPICRSPGFEPVLVTWWWGRISPNQPNLKGYQVLDDQDLETDCTNCPISN